LYRYLADSFIEPQSYYRALASGGVMCVFNLRQLEELSRADQDFVRRADAEYMMVLEKMHRRHLISDEDRWQGVAWPRDDSPEIVLVSFTDFSAELDGPQEVHDLTPGRTFRASESFEARPWHTYLLNSSSSPGER